MNSLLKELNGWQIKSLYEYGKIRLEGGDKTAREHYQKVLDENPELQIAFILDLAKHDKYVFELIEERAAIRAADGLLDDQYSAVSCNF